VTKTAPLSGRGVGGVLAEFEESLTRLGMASVYGLLVHSADDLLGESGSELAAALQRCRTGGLVEKIGVSAYTAPQLFAALDVLDADLVQVPVNAFDQRLVNGGALAEIEARGIEVHVRSAFLQGLLLMSPAELPAYFEPIRPHMEAWRVFCAARGMTPLAAALGFVLGLPQVDQVVVGVESAAQLAEIVTAVIPLDGADFRELALTDADMIDPTRWPR
jgi:aryl-alcohol dehydrogenase-like predicted oxidoreductase